MLKTVLGDQPALANLKTGQEIEAYIRIQDSTTRVDMYGKLVDHLYDNVFGRVAEPGAKLTGQANLRRAALTCCKSWVLLSMAQVRRIKPY